MRAFRPLELILSCEHGGNRIPAPYRDLFHAHQALLDSHRGYDPGSLVMAKALASTCRAPVVASHRGAIPEVVGDGARA